MGLSFYEKQHLQRIIQQQRNIKHIFNEFVRNAGRYLSRWENTGINRVWSRNITIEKLLEKEIETLRNKLSINIDNYINDAWNRSNKNTDELVSSFIEGLAVNEIAKQGMLKRNESALKTFHAKKVDGATLSDRVWKIADGAKKNIDFYLQTGFAEGRSAVKISQDIRQLLEDPDKRFRRVYEKGKLVYSKPMAAYHPGQGRYRSSYKNALRLAATNTNEMYRFTDCDRWSKFDFVIGIRIQRSTSNRGSCCICDSLAGDYPKDYIFTGWHPWCICYATPILMDRDEFIERLNSNDNSPAKQQIKNIPEDARKYFNEQLKKVNVNTYLFRNNKKYFKRIKYNSRAKVSSKNISKYIKEINGNTITKNNVIEIVSKYAKSNPMMFNGGLKRVKISRSSSAFMSNERVYLNDIYDGKGNTITLHDYDFKINDRIFNPYKELRGAFQTIKNNGNLSFNQEYSLESLWHEIQHARAKGWKSIENKTDVKRYVMETVNQFCARHSYPDFIKKLGGEAINKDKVLIDGLGYNVMLKNFNAILRRYEISAIETVQYFKPLLLEGNYEDLTREMTIFFLKKGIRNASKLVYNLILSNNKFNELL